MSVSEKRCTKSCHTLDGSTPETPPGTSTPDPDLQLVNSAWPGLPEPIRAGIVAMIRAAGNVRASPDGLANPNIPGK